MKNAIRFRLNGQPVTLDTEEDRTLLWVLRGDLGLTGTKCGCGAGICGSCTVVVDGKAVRSCQTTLKDVQGKDVMTIEGLARDGQLHPLQEAFVEHGAFQCGFCTPGHADERLRAAARTAAAVARGDRQGHGGQPLPLRRAPEDPRRRRSGVPRGRQAMSARLEMDRRSFIEILGGGIVVCVSLGPQELLAQERRPRLSHRRQRLSPDRRGRPRHGLLRQDRDGTGRPHLAGPDAGRGAGRRARIDRHGPGRHRPLPLGHGDLRLADHAHVRTGAARRRRRGARRARAARLRAARRRRRSVSSSRTASSP